MMPRTEINLTYVCAVPCNMFWSCSNLCIFSHQWFLQEPGVNLARGGAVPSQCHCLGDSLEAADSLQPVEGKEEQSQWYFLVTPLISLHCLKGDWQQSPGEGEEEFWALCSGHIHSQLLLQLPLHTGMGGNCSQGGRNSLTQPKGDFRAAPLLRAEGNGRREKQKKLHGEDFAWETTKLYFLPGKKSIFSPAAK